MREQAQKAVQKKLEDFSNAVADQVSHSHIMSHLSYCINLLLHWKIVGTIVMHVGIFGSSAPRKWSPDSRRLSRGDNLHFILIFDICILCATVPPVLFVISLLYW